MQMQLVILFLCCADIASKVKVGQTEFKRYPENLLNSRVRYGRAFQVKKVDSTHHSAVFMHCHWKQQPWVYTLAWPINNMFCLLRMVQHLMEHARSAGQ